MNELEGVLTNNVAAIVTTAIFIWYLIRKDKSQEDVLDKFNKTITDHLVQSSSVLRENIETRVKFIATIDNLVRVVSDLCKKFK